LPEAVLETYAFARAGLLGNPSDGYFGRTLSVALPIFRATVVLEPSGELIVEGESGRRDVFDDLEQLVQVVGERGHDGPAPLVTATLKAFHDSCTERGLGVARRGFTVRFRSDIPRQVGLAGSSAIITATLRALMTFFEVDIAPAQQANLVLSAEVDELGITAGLQDRVAQVYEGLVYMDFSKDLMDAQGHGAYESMDPALLPRMYLAYQVQSTKVSGRVLDDVRTRWEQGDPEVHEGLNAIAELATAGRDALLRGDHAAFASLMDRNFDLRRRIMRIDDLDLRVVEAARQLGASAKLSGSGGAVVGVYQDERTLAELKDRAAPLGIRVTELHTRSENAA
jgi:glucuronokinase